MELEKTTYMNSLVVFYGKLLTDKQLEYMELYYGNDYSLGEIAQEFNVSRQAVYDTIRRTGAVLEEYEKKLQLVADFQRRRALWKDIIQFVEQEYPKNERTDLLLEKIKKIDENE